MLLYSTPFVACNYCTQFACYVLRSITIFYHWYPLKNTIFNWKKILLIWSNHPMLYIKKCSKLVLKIGSAIRLGLSTTKMQSKYCINNWLPLIQSHLPHSYRYVRAFSACFHMYCIMTIMFPAETKHLLYRKRWSDYGGDFFFCQGWSF